MKEIGRIIKQTSRNALNKLLDLQYRLDKEIHQLKAVSIEVTGRCNLRCRHCYMNAGSDTDGPGPDFEQICTFINQVRHSYGRHVIFSVTGGEPLMRRDILQILKHLKKIGHRVNLVTNGLLLNRENVKQIIQSTGLISISLDGFAGQHNYLRSADVFEKTVDAIRLLKEHGARNLAIKTSVFAGNIAQLPEFGEFIESLGINSWHVFPVEPRGRALQNSEDLISKEEYLQLRRTIYSIKPNRSFEIVFDEQRIAKAASGSSCQDCRKKRCQAGISSMAVLHNGDVVSCIGNKRIASEVQGNIYSTCAASVWENSFRRNRSPEFKSCGSHHFSEAA